MNSLKSTRQQPTTKVTGLRLFRKMKIFRNFLLLLMETLGIVASFGCFFSFCFFYVELVLRAIGSGHELFGISLSGWFCYWLLLLFVLKGFCYAEKNFFGIESFRKQSFF